MAGPSGASDALKRFELENDVRETDEIFRFDNAVLQKNLAGKPWTKDPRWFKHVRVSALALVKMVMHARSGGSLEIMGALSATRAAAMAAVSPWLARVPPLTPPLAPPLTPPPPLPAQA